MSELLMAVPSTNYLKGLIFVPPARAAPRLNQCQHPAVTHNGQKANTNKVTRDVDVPNLISTNIHYCTLF